MSKKVLVFGLAFFMMGLIVFFGLWNSETVISNGREISQAEHRASVSAFFPLLFSLLGAGAAGWGGFMVFKERETEKYGWECYGLVTDIRSTHFKFNHVEQLKAVVLVETHEGSILELSAMIESNREGYVTGGFVRGKYLNTHLNLHGVISRQSIPADTAERLAAEFAGR